MIGVLLFLGHVFSSLFEKTRLPDVLPLMLLGVLLGPVFQIVSPQDFGEAGHIFTTLVLIMVLFKSGLNFRVLSLRGAALQGLLLTTVCFLIVLFTTASLSQQILGLSQIYSLVLGAILAGNSAAIIIPMLTKLNVSPTTKTILFLEANLTAVYSIVVALAFLSAAGKGTSLSAGKLVLEILRSFSFGILFAAIAGFFWMGILSRVRRLENAVSLTFAFVLLVYSVGKLIGADGAIATLMFGVVAGNIRLIKRLWLPGLDLGKLISFNKAEKSFFDEIEFMFRTLFFVYMGICMHLGRGGYLLVGLGFVLAKMLFRTVSINYCVSKKVSRTDCSVILAMCPNGLVSAVLAVSIANRLPAEGAVIQEVVYAVIFFSILLSNFMSYRIEKGGLFWLGRMFFKRHAKEASPEEEIPPQGTGGI